MKRFTDWFHALVDRWRARRSQQKLEAEFRPLKRRSVTDTPSILPIKPRRLT